MNLTSHTLANRAEKSSLTIAETACTSFDCAALAFPEEKN